MKKEKEKKEKKEKRKNEKKKKRKKRKKEKRKKEIRKKRRDFQKLFMLSPHVRRELQTHSISLLLIIVLVITV